MSAPAAKPAADAASPVVTAPKPASAPLPLPTPPAPPPGPAVRIDALTARDLLPVLEHAFLRRADAFGGAAKHAEAFGRWLGELEGGEGEAMPFSVVVRPEDVIHVREFMEEEEIELRVGAVAGFPNGGWYSTRAKMSEMWLALEEGASEVVFVMRHDALSAGRARETADEFERMIDGAAQVRPDIVVTAVLELGALTLPQVETAALIAEAEKLKFVATCSGDADVGHVVEALRVVKRNYPGGVKIMGNFGMRDVKAMLKAISDDGETIVLDPKKVRVVSSTLLQQARGHGGGGCVIA